MIRFGYTQRKATVIVVDDNSELRDIICVYLRLDGHHVLEAADGLSALALFYEQRPDAMVLDVMLPDSSGIAVLRAVRSVSTIPMLLMSAVARYRLCCFYAGADAFLSKPLRPLEVAQSIKRMLEQR